MSHYTQIITVKKLMQENYVYLRKKETLFNMEHFVFNQLSKRYWN